MTTDDLRRLWMEAIADDSEGLDPDPVFDALERKYADMARKRITHGSRDLTGLLKGDR